MATTTRKVLMLHGYMENAIIFSKTMGAIRKSCNENLELVFIDAPHVFQPADVDGSPAQYGDGEASVSDPALTPRAWWKVNDDRTVIYGIDSSLALLRETLKADRYEGIFGFSQGAAMATLLSALLEKPHIHSALLINDQLPHPPFKFCVAISGFIAPSPFANLVFSPSYSTHTLHVLGTNDSIIINEYSRRLIEFSENQRIEEHNGGHFVPSKPNWRKFFCDYLNDPLGKVSSPSPSLSSSSTGGSGAGKPTSAPVSSSKPEEISNVLRLMKL